MYLRTLSNIISKYHNISYHIHADDIQLIIKIPVNSLNSNLELLECESEIINWLLRNDLLVNTSKTELLDVPRLGYILIFNWLSLIVGLYIILLQFVILELSWIVYYLLMLTLALFQNLLTFIYVGLVMLESITLIVLLSYLLML